MALRVEELESRDALSVAFVFSYDPTFDAAFGPEYRAALEVAGRAVGRYLNPAGLPTTIPVTVYAVPLGPDVLARGGPTTSDRTHLRGLIDLDPTDAFAPSVAGPGAGAIDLVTVAAHELCHVLGVGTVADWDAGSRARGVAIAGDGQHFAPGVDALMTPSVGSGRHLPTAIDLAALNDLGWGVSFPGEPRFALVSVASPDGTCGLYLVTGAGAYYLGSTGRNLLAFGDFDLNGSRDLRVSPSRPGFEYTFSGTDGSLLGPPALTFGETLLVSYYQ